MRKQQYSNNDLPDTQPYDRSWVGGACHQHSNRIGGAFGWSKKEWTAHVDGLNRVKRLKREKLNSQSAPKR